MRPSLRFLALAVVGWAGFRAATLGALPGDIFSVQRSEAKVAPPSAPSRFAPIEAIAPATPIAPEAAAVSMPAPAPAPGVVPVQYVQGVVGVPVVMRPGVVPVYQLPAAAPARDADLPPRPTRLAYTVPTPEPVFYAELPPLGEWPVSRIASMSRPQSHSPVVVPAAALRPNAVDRIQLTAWALLRSQQTGIAGSSSLASGGTLGASQAGARLTYSFTRQVAASFRTTSEVGRRGAEFAAGVRVQPIASIPVWLTAERRQRIGQYSNGRNAFALFLEGGVYQRPMPWQFNLDGYLQAGVVGFRSRDGFVDGGLTLTRPVFRQFSAGFGVWGGAQPGLYRIDAGPRLTMKVRNNIRMHLDWRQRLAGNAQPGSGPALTLGADF